MEPLCVNPLPKRPRAVSASSACAAGGFSQGCPACTSSRPTAQPRQQKWQPATSSPGAGCGDPRHATHYDLRRQGTLRMDRGVIYPHRVHTVALYRDDTQLNARDARVNVRAAPIFAPKDGERPGEAVPLSFYELDAGGLGAGAIQAHRRLLVEEALREGGDEAELDDEADDGFDGAEAGVGVG